MKLSSLLTVGVAALGVDCSPGAFSERPLIPVTFSTQPPDVKRYADYCRFSVISSAETEMAELEAAWADTAEGQRVSDLSARGCATVCGKVTDPDVLEELVRELAQKVCLHVDPAVDGVVAALKTSELMGAITGMGDDDRVCLVARYGLGLKSDDSTETGRRLLQKCGK